MSVRASTTLAIASDPATISRTLSAPSVVTVIGEGHACEPTTRCAAGLACYLRNATAIDPAAAPSSSASEPDATCQPQSMPGFILAHPLATNAPLSEQPVPLRWPVYVNGPLADAGSSCLRMAIPRNGTLRAWLSARNEIDLSIIGSCVERAYCQGSPAADRHATPLDGRCHGVCMSGDGFLDEPAYRAFHTTIWLLMASGILLILRDWRTQGAPRWLVALAGGLSLLLLVAGVVYMVIPWPHT
ncbi:hypothetical protein SYNPS1DRAFT_24601 [Syncephalis pseudoplumigaleata]|uniref:Uncharacterized protein n=1 Tax=Syncephalis pseudoplumigaleata TaxID=1712513 RepID=A0A4P9YVT1_9FUNG|nr:hypothetical protein SYNPS1DRAFT_24601 [Syncephalis pseudoplumigaleata]|eukprot:RKP23351.1 hypothetical protein SYNPS1DRAFT_24601 [Syncephalis pseudoplumigaleata]